MEPGNRRVLAAFCIFCIIAIPMAMIPLRVRQHLIRNHVQRTLDEIQHLEIGHSSTCQIFSEWKQQWGTHLTSQARCDDPDRFSMDISVQNPPLLWPTCFENLSSAAQYYLKLGICRIYISLSGNPIIFMAHVEGAKGAVTRKLPEVLSSVADEDPGGRPTRFDRRSGQGDLEV